VQSLYYRLVIWLYSTIGHVSAIIETIPSLISLSSKICLLLGALRKWIFMSLAARGDCSVKWNTSIITYWIPLRIYTSKLWKKISKINKNGVKLDWIYYDYRQWIYEVNSRRDSYCISSSKIKQNQTMRTSLEKKKSWHFEV
jgi:hypothetical protein